MQKKKKKYSKLCILFMAALSLCLMLSCVVNVSAETNDIYAEMGDSEEETAYREFLLDKSYSADMKNLDAMMYGVYDVNDDQKKELIVKGLNTEDMHYEYTFYHYEDTQVQLIGTLDNWQNGGSGEMYYVAKGNGIVVNMRLADHMSYTLYQIKDKVEKNFTIHKQSVDVKKFGGKYKRQYRYSGEDENGDPLGVKIDDEVWTEFESRMQEIPFYELNTSEEISQYDANEEDEDSEKVTDTNKISDAVKIVGEVSGLQYMGSQTYNLSLQRDENNYSTLYPKIESGILAAFSMDFDGDGEEEIFSVSYDDSMQDELGKVLHFLILENNGETWEITSDQEIVTSSSYGDVIDRNCLDGECVKEEDSVFFREYDGTYEFFYEEYDTGIVGDGQEWFFKGFRLEDGNMEVIDETDELYFSGSPIDLLWENFEGDYSNELESFGSLGFDSPEVYFDNMTVDNNDCLYRILRMVRDTTCSSETISQWMGNTSQETLEGFTCTIKDQTGEIPQNIEEFQMDQYLTPGVVSEYTEERQKTVDDGDMYYNNLITLSDITDAGAYYDDRSFILFYLDGETCKGFLDREGNLIFYTPITAEAYDEEDIYAYDVNYDNGYNWFEFEDIFYVIDINGNIKGQYVAENVVSYGAGYTWTKQEDEGDWENTGETQYILHDPYGKTVLTYSIGNEFFDNWSFCNTYLGDGIFLYEKMNDELTDESVFLFDIYSLETSEIHVDPYHVIENGVRDHMIALVSNFEYGEEHDDDSVGKLVLIKNGEEQSIFIPQKYASDWSFCPSLLSWSDQYVLMLATHSSGDKFIIYDIKNQKFQTYDGKYKRYVKDYTGACTTVYKNTIAMRVEGADDKGYLCLVNADTMEESDNPIAANIFDDIYLENGILVVQDGSDTNFYNPEGDLLFSVQKDEELWEIGKDSLVLSKTDDSEEDTKKFQFVNFNGTELFKDINDNGSKRILDF